MTTLLKSVTGKVLKDPVKQMDRLVEHYSELYSRENIVNTEVLNNKDCLCIMGELDSEPKLDELGKALDTLSPGKASGKDGIPEVLKCVKGILIKDLHEIFCQCCIEGTVPQDMRDATLSLSTKTKVTGAIATAMVPSLFLALWGNSLLELS